MALPEASLERVPGDPETRFCGPAAGPLLVKVSVRRGNVKLLCVNLGKAQRDCVARVASNGAYGRHSSWRQATAAGSRDPPPATVRCRSTANCPVALGRASKSPLPAPGCRGTWATWGGAKQPGATCCSTWWFDAGMSDNSAPDCGTLERRTPSAVQRLRHVRHEIAIGDVAGQT